MNQRQSNVVHFTKAAVLINGAAFLFLDKRINGYGKNNNQPLNRSGSESGKSGTDGSCYNATL